MQSIASVLRTAPSAKLDQPTLQVYREHTHQVWSMNERERVVSRSEAIWMFELHGVGLVKTFKAGSRDRATPPHVSIFRS